MTDELQASRVYTDFQGMGALRTRAREGSPEALKVAAKQFEAYLVQQLLRASREASLDGGVLGNEGGGHYEDLFDKQLALSVTSGRGLGIADLLVQQLGRGTDESATSADDTPAETAPAEPVPVAPQAREPVLVHHETASKAPEGSPKAPEGSPGAPMTLLPQQGTSAGPDGSGFAADAVGGGLPALLAGGGESAPAEPTPARFASAEDFVAAVMPHARRVGTELGVDPRLLVAQAALETGWGQSIIRNGDGSSSHNLFNIKAHSSWDGPVASVRTREFIRGSETMVRAEFRSYDSFADSFRDYVDFLRSNPRYRTALTQTHDPEAFARSLQTAGYATDPSYADKIMSIYSTERLAGALA